MISAAPIRAVVAEDEPASRRRVVDLLGRHRDVTLVAECATGEAALEAVRRERPAVLFLDVRMPGLDGFDVVRALDACLPPAIVFVTAHDRYAVRAFDVRAVDYLLKPFDDERFERTMATIRASLATQRTLASLPPQNARRLPVPTDKGITFVPPGAITHATAEGCYVRIHTVTRTYLIRESLTSLERRLAPHPFIRVHRSALVNPDAVHNLERLSHGECRIWLTSGAQVKTSRRHRAALSGLTG